MADFVSFLLEIVAVFLGACFAFCFDNYRERQHEKGINQRALILIASEIGSNISIEKKLVATFQTGVDTSQYSVPYGRLGTVWATAANNLEVITDTLFLRDLAKLYYDFDVINRALAVYEKQASSVIAESDTKTRESIMSHLANHRNFILEAITNEETGLDFAQNVLERVVLEIRKASNPTLPLLTLNDLWPPINLTQNNTKRFAARSHTKRQ